MEATLSSPVIFLSVAAAAAAFWYLLHYLYIPRHLSEEPPVVWPSIPYIGHIIGLLRHGIKYYEITSKKCKLPIYTLNMLNGKVYIVTSPILVNAVNRNSKVLAFNPFIAQLGKRITGHDEATSRTVQHNLNGENGSGYVIEVHDAIVTALAPGRSLEKMTEAMLWEALAYLDKLNDQEVDLFDWTQQMVTMCSTRAIYGPKNPFNSDPNLTTAFWFVVTPYNGDYDFSNFMCRQFDRDLNLLLIDFAPNIIAPKGNRARLALARAFQQYFENFIPGRTSCSAMTQARYTANTHYGITSQNQGRLEVGTLIGILANTIPAIFYMLVHVYSDPILLQDIRAELETTSVSTPDPDEPRTRYLQILSMRERCHLLHSTFQELLRLHARGASARFVREDIMLDGQYLLKKGMVVQMPMGVMHSDPTIWGADATVFQPRRFWNKNNSPAYRPFGGGASLCPGRHFVTLEILALTACMVLKYDMASVDGGPLRIPNQKQESLATNVFPPENDLRVTFLMVLKIHGESNAASFFETSETPIFHIPPAVDVQRKYGVAISYSVPCGAMAKRNGDDEAQVDHLSKRPRVHGKDRQAKAFSHWTTSTHAFPSSAAAFHNGLHWIGTPWIQGPEITALTLRKISDRAHGHLGFERPAIPVMMQLGSPAFISDFTVYAVFPNLQKSIAVTPDCKYLEKWTDKIMLPTMYKFLNGSRLQYLTPSHRMIVLNSRAERIEAMRDVGDNPYKYYLLGDVFRQVWDEVVTTTQQAQFAEFRDVFLVAVGDLHPTSTASVDFEQALEKTFQIWEDFMDMQEVAKGDLEIRIETQMII